MLLNLQKHKYHVFDGDKFAAAFSNEALAARTAVYWQTHFREDGARRSMRRPHSVMRPDGTYVHASNYVLTMSDIGGYVVIAGIKETSLKPLVPVLQ